MPFDACLAYIHSDTPNEVRVSKCIPLFRRLFRDVHFIGCSRGHRTWPEETTQGVRYYLDERCVAHGLRGIGNTLRFVRYISRQLRCIRPDVVVATNEEYVLPFLLGYFPRPKVLVCDLIDSISIRIVGPLRHLHPVWNSISVLAKLRADGLVEVTEERLGRHMIKPKHCTVVVNSPPWAEVKARRDLPSPAIYVCGSVQDQISGAETLLAACESVPAMSIVFAGRALGRWMRECFLKHPRVLDLGETSPAGSLEIARGCTALFAHYKPFITNHIYAAPNKLYDAMMVGIPLLINSECKISRFAEKAGFGIATPFGDVSALRRSLELLAGPHEALRQNCASAQLMFREKYAWQNMEQQWVDLFHELGVPLAQPAVAAGTVMS